MKDVPKAVPSRQQEVTVAIVRCEECGLDFTRTQLSYHRTPVEPVGYPDTAAICGRAGCVNPGLVWLEVDEQREYTQGKRYFRLKTYTIKVKVQ